MFQEKGLDAHPDKTSDLKNTGRKKIKSDSTEPWQISSKAETI